MKIRSAIAATLGDIDPEGLDRAADEAPAPAADGPAETASPA